MVSLGYLVKFKLFEGLCSVLLYLDLGLTLIFTICQNQEKRVNQRLKATFIIKHFLLAIYSSWGKNAFFLVER